MSQSHVAMPFWLLPASEPVSCTEKDIRFDLVLDVSTYVGQSRKLRSCTSAHQTDSFVRNRRLVDHIFCSILVARFGISAEGRRSLHQIRCTSTKRKDPVAEGINIV